MDSVVDIMKGVLLLLLLRRVWWRCCCVAAGRKEDGEKAWVVEGRRTRRTPRRKAGRGGSGSRMVLLDARSLWLIRRCCVLRASVEEEGRLKNKRLCSREQQRQACLLCCGK